MVYSEAPKLFAKAYARTRHSMAQGQRSTCPELRAVGLDGKRQRTSAWLLSPMMSFASWCVRRVLDEFDPALHEALKIASWEKK